MMFFHFCILLCSTEELRKYTKKEDTNVSLIHTQTGAREKGKISGDIKQRQEGGEEKPSTLCRFICFLRMGHRLGTRSNKQREPMGV